jgi:hypothetical protein
LDASYLLYVEDDEDLISVIRAALADRVEIVPARNLRDAFLTMRRCDQYAAILRLHSQRRADGCRVMVRRVACRLK